MLWNVDGWHEVVEREREFVILGAGLQGLTIVVTGDQLPVLEAHVLRSPPNAFRNLLRPSATLSDYSTLFATL